MRKEYRELNETVYPSNEKTLSVIREDEYDGAHVYYARNCNGFENGKTGYVTTEQQIRFVKKSKDGSVIPGLQSEQLLHILIDRHKKLNAAFPSEFNEDFIAHLEGALQSQRNRVDDRINRGTMGKLEK